MNKYDAIIAAQAIYSMLGKALGTKDPSNLRGVLDARYNALYKQTGGKSYDLMIGGQEVGTYTFKKNKDKKELHVSIEDYYAFRSWIINSDFLDVLIDEILANPKTLVDFIKQTGEIPNGASVEEHVIQGGISERGALKVDFDKVRKALGGDFSPAIEAVNDTKLLNEGNEE